MPAYMGKEQALAKMAAVGKNGRFFTVDFVKRTDGSFRSMNCRFGVRKGVKGVGLAFDPKDKDLVVVRDVQKQEFRMINLNAVLAVRGVERK